MKKVFGHIIKILAVLVMIICWILAIGYTNELGLMKNTFNLYLEDETYVATDIYTIQREEAKKEQAISFTAWYEKENQKIVNPNFNRTIESNIILICGNSSLIAKGPLLFEDDKNGCLIDEESANKLFGSTEVLGNVIVYEDRELIIRGIHQGVENTIIAQAVENSSDKIQGIYIDISNDNKENIKLLNERYGFKEQGVNSIIYYNIGIMATSLLPIIILLIVVFNLFKEVIANKNKPFFFMISSILLIVAIIIFFKITKYNISIPVDILPNKWSDFDYWRELFKEYIDKAKYVLYMKKYSMDIYFISYVTKILMYTLITISLLFINIKNIKVGSKKELFISLVSVIIITFISFIICRNSNINDSPLIIWLMCPYYLIYEFFKLNKDKVVDKLNKSLD